MSYIPLTYKGKDITIKSDEHNEEFVIKNGDLCKTDPKDLFSTKGLSTLDSDKLFKEKVVSIISIHSKSNVYTVPVSDVTIRRPCKLAKHTWYFGKLSRESADNILKNTKSGSFLVRRSNKSTDLVLEISETTLGERLSFKIKKKNGLYYISRILNFKSVNHLIEFYYSDIVGSLVKLSYLADRNPFSRDLFTSEFLANGWIIDEKNVVIGKRFDGGQYGTIYQGTYNDLPVAIKVMQNEQAYIDNFMVETAFLTFCCHVNIISLYGIMQKDNQIYSIIEFCKNSSIENYLHSHGFNRLKKRDLVSYAFQLSSALAFISELKLVHRDVAARNVLLTEDMVAKLCDFGSMTTEYSFQRPIEYAIRWTAPEIYTHKIHSQYSDVWSYGVFLWELFTYGRNPYPQWQNEEIIDNLVKGARLPIPELCPPSIAELITNCWNIVPNKRPQFSDINNTLKNLDIYQSGTSDECYSLEIKIDSVYEELD